MKLKVTNKLPTGLHQIHQAGPVEPNGLYHHGHTLIHRLPANTLARWTDEHRVCVHLHGGKVLTEHDGGPRDWFSPVGSTQANPYPEGKTLIRKNQVPIHTNIQTTKQRQCYGIMTMHGESQDSTHS